MAKDPLDSSNVLTRPRRFLGRMEGFLFIAALAALVLVGPIREAFDANPMLNGLILGVLLFGIVYQFRQVLTLTPEIKWVNSFRRADPGLAVQNPPVLLAPMAAMLGERAGQVTLSTLSTRSFLDSIASRLDEGREISRYLIGLLIFLGLLGTFWGLLDTVSSVTGTIRSLSVDPQNSATAFEELRAGLQAPLAGMGTAFSSSLFGLAGSLVLGFLDLQASQAQSRFYNELEEWLSTITKLSPGLGEGDLPADMLRAMETRAEDLEALRSRLGQEEYERSATNASLLALTEHLEALTEQVRAEQQLLMRLVEAQEDMAPLLKRLLDENTRKRREP